VGWVLGISGRVVATLEGLVLLDKKLELLWRQPGCWRSVAVGALIAAGSNAGMIMLFLEDGTQIAAWKAHTGPVLSLAWGPGGLLSGGEDGAVKLWNHEKLEEEWRMGNFVTATGWIGDKPGWGGYSGAYVAGKAIREVV
jgi:WD40 repeat protein